MRPRIRTHHSQRGDPGPHVHLRHRVIVPRIGDLVLLKLPAQSPCRRYHRFRWRRSHLRREDGDLLRACCPHRRSPEHGHAFALFRLYARISSNFGWDAFTARSVPASNCARSSAGSSLICPSYADAFNLFVFNQLTSSHSAKSSAGWFTRNDARRLPGSPVKSQVSVVPAAGFSVFHMADRRARTHKTCLRFYNRLP